MRPDHVTTRSQRSMSRRQASVPGILRWRGIAGFGAVGHLAARGLACESRRKAAGLAPASVSAAR